MSVICQACFQRTHVENFKVIFSWKQNQTHIIQTLIWLPACLSFLRMNPSQGYFSSYVVTTKSPTDAMVPWLVSRNLDEEILVSVWAYLFLKTHKTFISFVLGINYIPNYSPYDWAFWFIKVKFKKGKKEKQFYSFFLVAHYPSCYF